MTSEGAEWPSPERPVRQPSAPDPDERVLMDQAAAVLQWPREDTGMSEQQQGGQQQGGQQPGQDEQQDQPQGDQGQQQGTQDQPQGEEQGEQQGGQQQGGGQQ